MEEHRPRALTFAVAAFVLMCVPAAARAQANPHVRLLSSDLEGALLRVEPREPAMISRDTPMGAFTRLGCEGCGVTTRVGAPQLPVIREHLELPRGATPRLRVLDATWEEVDLRALGLPARVYPAQPPVPKLPGAREAVAFRFDPKAYGEDGLIGAEAAALGDVGQVRAHRFVELEIFPVAYGPAGGVLRRLTGATVEVTFEGADPAATSRALERYASPGFDGFAARRFLNGGDFEALSKAPLELPLGYLIITHDDYADEILPFALLRHSLGYRVTVTKMSELEGQSAQEVADYIKEAYDTWDAPPTFVLLVGDTGQVPCFQIDEGWDTIATDLFFATMDGGDDWFPDLYVGRFSCDTEAEAAILAAKTVDYVLYTLGPDASWIKNATFMASEDNSEVSEGTHDYVIGTWLEPDGYECSERYTVTYGATTQQVVGDINAGLSQLTYSGHGAEDGWYDGPPLNMEQVQILGNDLMYPVVQSYACLTGAYLEDCFAEAWTTSDNGGVLFFGSSINSMWDEDDILERGVYDAWFGADPRTVIRDAFNEGLWELYEEYSGGGSTRQYFQQYNVFGDPALDPWTEEPRALTVDYEEEAEAGAVTFLAAVSDPSSVPVEGALVCVRGGDGIYETAYSDAAGQVEIDLGAPLEEGDALHIGVSKHDFVPFFGEVTVPDPGASDADSDTDSDSDTDADSDADADTDAQAPATTFNPGSSGCGCDPSGRAAPRRSLLEAITVAIN